MWDASSLLLLMLDVSSSTWEVSMMTMWVVHQQCGLLLTQLSSTWAVIDEAIVDMDVVNVPSLILVCTLVLVLALTLTGTAVVV